MRGTGSDCSATRQVKNLQLKKEREYCYFRRMERGKLQQEKVWVGLEGIFLLEKDVGHRWGVGQVVKPKMHTHVGGVMG